MKKRKAKKVPEGSFAAQIENLSHDGRGIAKINQKTVFIDNALPNETVKFHYKQCHSRYDEGFADDILDPAPIRETPKCEYFNICGGCSLQHIQITAQQQLKQQTLLEQLKHFGGIEVKTLLPILSANSWGYRRKARLGVRYVAKKQKVLLGFREKRSNFLMDMTYCEVLHPEAAKLIQPLREMLLSLEAFETIPQIEVAVDSEKVALIVRHLQPLSTIDQDILSQFAADHEIWLYLQPKGADSIHLQAPKINAEPLLHYDFPEYGVTQYFMPNDFAQVNLALNKKMIARVLELFNLNENDRVLDLFCGFGNFTLPMAKLCRHIVGVEGSETSIERAKHNALSNGIKNTDFFCYDLEKDFSEQAWAQKKYDKILLDPARAGAQHVVEHIEVFSAQIIIYVSCNPATLARDAGILVKKGYNLISAGIMDMFPHTNHVESIAVFEKIELRKK